MRTSIWDDFKMYVLRSGNTLNHLIAINIAVFIVFGLLWVILSLFTLDPLLYESLRRIFSFPSLPLQFLYKPWTIITYQFMHAGPLHLFFNMMVFWFAGRIFREFLGDKKLLSVYILGGSAGAVIFMLAYNIFPLFDGYHPPLIGASASVMAILAAIGTLLPTYTVNLILIGGVRLIYVVLALMVIDLLSLAGSNAGGSFAHLGGMLWGFVYIRALQKGTDLGGWFTRFTDWINRLFAKKSPMKRVHVNNERGHMTRTPPKKNRIPQEQVDAILDKIAKSGYDSLSDQEKDVLFRASKDN